MDFPWIQFVILTLVVAGGVIFFFRVFMFSSTEGALRRLDEEISRATRKQMELSEKIRLADEELERRKTEARQLADKMRTDAEEASKSEREKIIANARKEGEEIIAKAQTAKEKMRTDLEKEMDMKAITFGMGILNTVLSQKAKGTLDEVLIDEFVGKLQNVDMSRIGHDVKSADLITLTPVNEQMKNRISQVVKQKLNRDIALNASVDPNIGGGVILKFGSMALDGSIKNMIREVGLSQQRDVEMS